MKAISSANPNRNGSYFTKESMEKAIPTFYNKPILASFDEVNDDYRGHEGDLEYDNELEQWYYNYLSSTSERPLGLIRQEDMVEIYQDFDGLYWIKFTCALWVKYSYKQVKRLLKSRNGKKKISVEVEINDYYTDENGTMVITDFTFDGVTILSDKLETGIADATLSILDKISDINFQKAKSCLTFAYGDTEQKPQEDKEDYLEINIVDINEDKDEITMDQEEKDKMLTYENKRSLLENQLNLIVAEDCDEHDCYVWVADLDEESVYFNFKGSYYRASYSIEEMEDEDDKVFVDFEGKEQVVRSWTKFNAENPEGSFDPEDIVPIKENESKVCPDCGKEMDKCECKNAATDPEKNPKEKPIEDESVDPENECKNSCDPENECKNECDPENQCKNAATDPEDNPKEKPIENEAATDPEDNPKEKPVEDECNMQDNPYPKGIMNKTVEINGESYDVDSLFVLYNDLSTNYANLETEYNDLRVKFEEAKNKEFLEFGHSEINGENRLSEKQKEDIIADFDASFEGKNYQSVEEVKKDIIGMIAMSIYEYGENSTKEFSVNLNKSEHVHSLNKSNRLDEMKELSKKLDEI